IITVMRIIADRKDITMETRMTAKIKTLSQMMILYTVLLVGVFINTDVWLSSYSKQLLNSGILGLLMLAVVALTIYSGIEYTYININIFTTQHDTKTYTYNRQFFLRRLSSKCSRNLGQFFCPILYLLH